MIIIGIVIIMIIIIFMIIFMLLLITIMKILSFDDSASQYGHNMASLPESDVITFSGRIVT